MRRLVPLGFLLTLAGCGHYASSPFDGFGGYVGDTHTFHANANLPVGDSDNIRRVQGLPTVSAPLTPEPGNVWPGPQAPDKTLQDIERNPDDMLKPGDEMNISPRGSSTFPGSNQPGLTVPGTQAPRPALPDHAQSRPSTGSVVQTPSGPAIINRQGSVPTYTAPNGTNGLVVPNGNGTSTLVAPDGSIQTVPSPR